MYLLCQCLRCCGLDLWYPVVVCICFARCSDLSLVKCTLVTCSSVFCMFMCVGYCYVCEGDSVVYVCYEASTLFMYSVCSDGCVVGYVWCFMSCVEFWLS